MFYEITSWNEDPLFIGLFHCRFSVSRTRTKVPAGKENKWCGRVSAGQPQIPLVTRPPAFLTVPIDREPETGY